MNELTIISIIADEMDLFLTWTYHSDEQIMTAYDEKNEQRFEVLFEAGSVDNWEITTLTGSVLKRGYTFTSLLGEMLGGKF